MRKVKESLGLVPRPNVNARQIRADVHPQSRLETMPGELLLQICRYIADPDEILERKARDAINTLCDLSLTSRRLKPISQEVLVNTIVLEAGECGRTGERLATLIKFS